MTEHGHLFKYRHDNNRHSITIEADQDLSLPALFEVIDDYLIACGFSQKSIDDYYKGRDND